MYTKGAEHKTPTEVPMREARARFAEILSRAEYGDEEFVITRHGKPVARLVRASAA